MYAPAENSRLFHLVHLQSRKPQALVLLPLTSQLIIRKTVAEFPGRSGTLSLLEAGPGSEWLEHPVRT